MGQIRKTDLQIYFAANVGLFLAQHLRLMTLENAFEKPAIHHVPNAKYFCIIRELYTRT